MQPVTSGLIKNFLAISLTLQSLKVVGQQPSLLHSMPALAVVAAPQLWADSIGGAAAPPALVVSALFLRKLTFLKLLAVWGLPRRWQRAAPDFGTQVTER